MQTAGVLAHPGIQGKHLVVQPSHSVKPISVMESSDCYLERELLPARLREEHAVTRDQSGGSVDVNSTTWLQIVWRRRGDSVRAP
jgi:hypothetical protein